MISTLRKQRQVDLHEFKDSLASIRLKQVYIVRCLKRKKKSSERRRRRRRWRRRRKRKRRRRRGWKEKKKSRNERETKR